MRRARGLALAGLIASLALSVPAGVAAAGPIVVDDDGAQCKRADFTTIQAAVTAAPAGTKIQVCAGTYTEQVSVPAGKNGLTLEAKGGGTATIKAPALMAGNKAIVEVTASQNVTIKGLTITGPGGGPCDSLRYGVRLQGGASATIEKNYITMIRDTPFSGCQNGNAIQVGRMSEGQTATALIKNNVIDAFQKSGIVVDNAGSFAEIANNDLTGVGPTAAIAQNAIQVSRGATANVHHNDISDLQYSPQTTFSGGILLFQAGNGVVVSQNDIARTDEGLYAFQSNGLQASHNNSSNNTFDGFGIDDTTGAKLSHNEANDNGFDGIWVNSDATGNTFDHNKMADNGEHDAHDSAPSGANTWTQNSCDTESQPGLCD